MYSIEIALYQVYLVPVVPGYQVESLSIIAVTTWYLTWYCGTSTSPRYQYGTIPAGGSTKMLTTGSTTTVLWYCSAIYPGTV